MKGQFQKSMAFLAYLLSGLSLLMSILFIIQLKAPLGFMVWIPKLAAGALAPYWAITGAVGAVLGWVYQAPWTILMGGIGAGIMIWYVLRCTHSHTGFEKAFGEDWQRHISTRQTKQMVQRRWTWVLPMKASPEPAWERDITFWTIPGAGRDLLCDLWHPTGGHVSSLAVIYFHGSAWYMLDKDFGTRPFFRHLVAQGYTVMDVAYRLCPEVDIFGMIGDVKHAIAWMKANTSRYGVNPDNIVLAGGSAGGHLSLLAGYAPQHPELTPEELKDTDLSVCGVISYYGPSDLLAVYEHTQQQRMANLPPVPIGEVLDSAKNMRDAGRLDILLGGHPREAFHAYQIGSPINHVHPGCPPTLLIQGEQDLISPVEATITLYDKLIEARVPAINLVYPWTNHGFDLIFPQINPAAQSALYDVDRFLAVLLRNE